MEAVCPSCQRTFRRVRDELIGKKAKCTCGNTFVLGEINRLTQEPVERETVHKPDRDSIDLSSADVFENSYSDLDQILAGYGSTAPLPSQSEGTSSSATDANARKSSQVGDSKKRTADSSHQEFAGYGSAGMSIGFIAAVLSGSLAVWFSIFLLSSRSSVLGYQPLNLISQTIHDIARATFGDLAISPTLERSFVVLGWVTSGLAMCLLVLGIGQLFNAFAKLFRQRHMFRGIDGGTGLVASVLLFLILSTLFFHSSHMSQLNRDLIHKAGGQIDENTVLGRNLKELQAKYVAHSRHFVNCVAVIALAPLCVCLLSLTRVYVTLGEVEPDKMIKPNCGR